MIAQREIAPGIAVAAIGFGGYHLGLIESEGEAIRLLHAAIDAGITFLDNAWEYNEHRSEERMYDDDPARHYAKGGVVEALDRAKHEGKVRFVGFTGLAKAASKRSA
jgi:aryl-alcohol dehydrogenase-like predicted oxidoreductase